MADTAAPTTSAPPLVSAVIIFLNGERFIGEAIESVLAQAYANWELLLVDDGSTDGATAIARSYAERFPDRVRYLEHDGHANRGMSASRNLGIRHARGEFIAFLDADDVWLPNKLADQVPMLVSRPQVAMLYGRTHIWFGWTGEPADAARDYVTQFNGLTGRVVDGRELLATFLGSEDHLPCTCSVLVRKDAAERAGLFEESFRTTYEDMAFYAKLFPRSRVYVADGCWDRYRQHPQSSCHQAIASGDHDPNRPSRDRERYLRFVERHLNETGVDDPALRGVLAKQLWPYRHASAYAAYRRLRAFARPLKLLAKRMLPTRLLPWARAARQGKGGWPPPGLVRFGSLRRTMPVCRGFGYDRGTPVDRHYIERFLADHAGDVRGRVLEVGDDSYTRRFGGDRVTQRDVLHAIEGNPQATLVGDLATGRGIPRGAFDCIILTQTLFCVYDVAAAIRSARDALRPGGVLLATLPGISQISAYDRERWGDYWRFTSQSARRLFEDSFGGDSVDVRAYGNVLAATALLHGLTCEELRADELDARDDEFEVIVAVRAVSRGDGGTPT